MDFSKLSEYEGYLLPQEKILHKYTVWPMDYNSWSADGLISDEVQSIQAFLVWLFGPD